MATSWLPRESTSTVMNINSVETVGEAASSLLILSGWFILSVHARPCMSPFRFPFRSIRDVTASSHYFVSLVASIGAKVFRMCSCAGYFVTYDSTRSLKFLKPVFSEHFYMIMWIMWLSYSSLFICIVALYVFRWMFPMSWFLLSMVGIKMITWLLVLIG